jgi:hypothetical protein
MGYSYFLPKSSFISPAIQYCIVQIMAMNHSKMMNTDQVCQAVTLLMCNWEVIGSNVGLGTDYPDNFRGFPHSLQGNAEIVP